MSTVEVHDFDDLNAAVEFIKQEGFVLTGNKGDCFCCKCCDKGKQVAHIAQAENDHYIVQFENMAA